MSATGTAIPQVDLDNRAKDRPLVVGRNAFEIAYTSGSIRANTAGTVGAADASDATFGIKFLQDRLAHTPWKFGAAVTDVYLVVDTGSADGSRDVDALVVQGHNWDTCTITVEADLATPAVPWTGATSVFSFVVSGSTLILRLHATTSYKARYWRIRIQRGSAFVPQADQIFLGKAIQFPIKSNYDHVPAEAAIGSVTEIKTRGGVRYAYRNHGALQQRKQQFTINGRPSGTFLTDLKAFFDDTDQTYGGTKPFWYCEDPTAAPSKAKFIYLTDPRFDVVVAGPNETVLHLETTEQGAG